MSTAIQRRQDEQGIVTLVFDQPDTSANVFNQALLDELDKQLAELEGMTEVKGLVFTSAKDSIFIAGADISQFADLDDQEKAAAVIQRGQQLFRRIEQLPFPTVAAIHGAALGGGCELALACDYRLASPDRCTRIGLPEVTLGILPGWGGCYRLPRLIGLVKALDMILGGKRWVPKQALKAGLVDLLVPREHFERLAASKIAEGKREPSRHPWLHNAVVRAVVGDKARKNVLEKTRGHYPAPAKALFVVLEGLGCSFAEAMKHEEEAFIELVQTQECQNLVRVFFMQENAKKRRVEGVDREQITPVKKVAVIGAGVMGAGIAQWVSSRGYQTLLKDISPEALAKGMGSIAKLYSKAVKRRLFSKVEARQGMDRILATHESVPLNRVDLVVEAATENMELKKKIFSGLAGDSAPETILATNTSALSISELATAVPHPERVVGIHYFNPPSRMPLVEVVRGTQTSDLTLARAVSFVQASGKMPVVVKDSPGFVVNRILMPYLIEAGLLFEQGAPIDRIDEAMLDFGMPMGPCRLIDEIGVDVAHHVAQFFADVYGDRMPLPRVLQAMMDKDWLGHKSGKGFYTYSKKGGSAVNIGTDCLVDLQQFAEIKSTTIQERMLCLMINEAARCLEEEVVARPEDIDFAMIMGTGFAPFRGGPLRYADAIGSHHVKELLHELAKQNHPRFEPCALLNKMAEHNETFYTQTP